MPLFLYELLLADFAHVRFTCILRLNMRWTPPQIWFTFFDDDQVHFKIWRLSSPDHFLSLLHWKPLHPLTYWSTIHLTCYGCTTKEYIVILAVQHKVSEFWLWPNILSRYANQCSDFQWKKKQNLTSCSEEFRGLTVFNLTKRWNSLWQKRVSQMCRVLIVYPSLQKRDWYKSP